MATETKGMSEDELSRLLSYEISDSLSFIHSSDSIADDRELNYEYYRGVMTDLPVPRGRSRVTDRSVSEYINMMIPSLIRVFTAGPKIAEYAPTGPEDEAIAEIITKYVNETVFNKDNRGEILIHNQLFDGLVQKTGVLKVYWNEKFETDDTVYDNLTDPELVQLGLQVQQNPELEIVAYGDEEAVPDTVMEAPHTVTVRRTINKSHVGIDSIPNEEFLVNRDARNLDDATIQSHRTYRRVGDLIQEGYEESVVKALPTFNEDRNRRTRADDYYRTRGGNASPDPMMEEKLIHEGIVKCDFDGEGIKPWYFVAGGGDGAVEILEMEPFQDQIYFSCFTPQPIPHTFWGRCPADDLVEIQRVKTVITRLMLDSGYLHLNPQREVVFSDLEKPEQLSLMSPGSSVFVKKPGTIREISVPFVGQSALPMLQHFDSQAESRTGISRGAMGLDPDTLQNQSATAAQLAWNASMGKVELIARIYADTAMRQLFQGILKILIRYQDFPRMVRMSGQQVQIDPRQWEAFTDADVSISTGLGTGNRDRDIAFLNQISQQQLGMLQAIGPNPSVGWSQFIRTQQKMAEAAGIANPEMFFADMPPDWQPQPPPEPPPPPDPRILEVQRKAARDQADIQIDQAEIQLKARELALKEAQVMMSAGQDMSEKDIQTLILQYEKMLQENALKREQIAMNLDLKAAELEAEIQLEKYAIDNDSPKGQGIIPN